MYDEKPTANDRDIDEFLEEFELLILIINYLLSDMQVHS